jgi:class 3 adenylate cyclase
MAKDNKQNYERLEGMFLFADLVGSMECANYYSPEDYNTLLTQFHDHFWNTISSLDGYAYFKDLGSGEIRAAGDEVSLFLPARENIATILSVALVFKASWLISDTNLSRIKDGKPPIDVAIGINMGPIVKGPRSGWSRENGLLKDFGFGMEGLAISLAKRLETFGREGLFSRIMVGQTVADYLLRNRMPYQFHPHGKIGIKGFSQGIPIYELKTCWSYMLFYRGHKPEGFSEKIERVMGTDPTNAWYYLWMADSLALDREYKTADRFAYLALKYDRDNAQACLIRAEAALWSQDYKVAKDYFNQAVQLGGDGFVRSASSDIAFDGQKRFKEFDKISPPV